MAKDSKKNSRVNHFKPEEMNRFLDICSLSREQKAAMAQGDLKSRTAMTLPIDKVKTEQVRAIAPLAWWEELICILFLAFGPPNCVLTIPLVTTLLGFFVLHDIGRAFTILGILLLPLAIMPQSFVPSSLNSWMSHLIIRYFSFRFAYDQPLATQHATESPHAPQILVAPPHGVFPYGNILSLLAWPIMSGHHFLGLASSAAVKPPIFKQVLRRIGVIDASRSTARKALEVWPFTIGISTGGVAEVYETNAEHECILLKERIGLIKLAIRTGADLLPCYLFGNTKLLSCYLPGGRLLEGLSRKVGFAMILFYGRFGLAIPYREPILGVVGKPIPTNHLGGIEEPTMEQIQEIQDQLIEAVQDLFERYKGVYGWEDKDLIIK